MRKCLLCEQYFQAPFSFWQLLTWQRSIDPCLCRACRQQFTVLKGRRCLYCSKEIKKKGICSDCKAWQALYQGKILKNHAVCAYDLPFHNLMVAYKRRGDYVLRQVLQELCQAELQKLTFDYYVPIPTSPEHQAQRQFDTITAIYQDLLPLSLFLGKKEGGTAQGEKNKQARLQTPQEFYLTDEAKACTNQSKVSMLLLDDIYTTGRTLYHARDKLLEHFPAAKIESFTICH